MLDSNILFIFIIVLILILLMGLFIGSKLGKSKGLKQSQVFEKEATENRLKAEQYQTQLNQQKKDFQDRFTEIKDERDQLRREKDLLNNDLIQRNTEFINLEKQLKTQKTQVENLQEKFKEEFENLASKILEQKSEKFTKINKSNIENILTPLQKRIKGFEEEIKKNQAESIRNHAQLDQHLKTLNEHNIKISQEANNLTKALKGESKTQGNWGEKILERVLEKSGLQENREYFTQQSFETENGKRLQPDVVIHLPNEKQMIIDSKVSLTAYEKYINEEDKTLKAKYLKQHIASLKKHINELQSKRYEDLLKGKSPDFVLMFVPIGPALFKAQEEDLSFFNTAFQQNILLVTPTTLLATLRTVDALWSNDKQHQNAQEIAKHASSLYHKFCNLITELEKVGKQIDSSKVSYQNAMKKLTGQQNLIKDIQKLEKLGISPKEKLAQKWTAHTNQINENN